MRTPRTSILAVAILAVAACSDDDVSTAPAAHGDASVADVAARGGAAAADTTRPIAGTARVQGRVRGAAWRAPGQGSADTTRLTPIAGATLRLYRNVLVDGRGVSRFVGQTTSAADGSYSFGEIEGGYYLVYTSVPGMSGEHLDYLPATTPSVTLNVTIWRREDPAPADSTGG
jgi:hypothetical protein